MVNKALKSETASVQRGSVDSVLDGYFDEQTSKPRKTFDVVFLDPPYPLTEAELKTTLYKVSRVLADDATVIVERSSRSPEPVWPEMVQRFADKKYGRRTYGLPNPSSPSECLISDGKGPAAWH